MRKLVITTLMLLSCGVVHALPLGNPTEASLFRNGMWCSSSCCDPCDPCFSWCDAWSLRIGFYGDYVFDRHMENDFESNTHDINDFQMSTNAGYLVLNICNRVDFFGTLGATHINIEANDIAFGQPVAIGTDIHLTTDFSWSVGSRISIWDWKCFGVGVEGQYFQTKPNLDFATFDNSGQLRYFNEDRGVCYREWQVGLGASYRFTTGCPSLALVPYAGVKWSGSKFKTDDPLIFGTVAQRVRDEKSKKLWGWAIGTTLMLNDVVAATVEGRFADETALYVNGQFRF